MNITSATLPPAPSNAGGDFATCDREPIQIPGSIQPHGCLLTLRLPDLEVLQFSQNLPEMLGIEMTGLLGRSFDSIANGEIVSELRQAIQSGTLRGNPMYIGQLVTHSGEQRFNLIAHIPGDWMIVEMEPVERESDITFNQLYGLVRDFVNSLQHVATVSRLAALASQGVRRITGFDRVLVYQFDEEWNGAVVGESLDPEAYAPYMDLRFPASDIPRQARELYRLNRLRLIVDANYRPVPLVPTLNPLDGKPLDLSHAGLRSVSPVHVEYLKNMNAMASMSISILRDNQLWGLIACHHRQPLKLSFETRAACDFIGQVLSVQMEARQTAIESATRSDLRSLAATLLSTLSQGVSVQEGLTANASELLQFGSANGVAVAIEGSLTLLGDTPLEADVATMIDWLADHATSDDVWSTDTLATLYPPAGALLHRAAGLMAIRISKLHKSYVLWFRPEVVQTVRWSGDPRKVVTTENGVERLHPRKSFEIWRETVSGRSLKWMPAQLEAATELRNALVGIVLRNAEELASLSAELESSNKELEAFSYSVSHDLRAPFRHIVGYAQLLRESLGTDLDAERSRYLTTVIESAQYAGKLVDNLLSFSRMGRSALKLADVDLNETVRGICQEFPRNAAGVTVQWNVQALPTVHGDRMMLELVIRNLLENAVKYSREAKPPRIEIGSLPTQKSPEGVLEQIVFVRDNGVGFDMEYVNKLFGVFQRLHRSEEYEGTGIGLANVRRIISRHGGRTWAEGELTKGATFYFSIPLGND